MGRRTAPMAREQQSAYLAYKRRPRLHHASPVNVSAMGKSALPKVRLLTSTWAMSTT